MKGDFCQNCIKCLSPILWLFSRAKNILLFIWEQSVSRMQALGSRAAYTSLLPRSGEEGLRRKPNLGRIQARAQDLDALHVLQSGHGSLLLSSSCSAWLPLPLSCSSPLFPGGLRWALTHCSPSW